MANLQDLFNEIQADSRISNPPTFEEFQSKMEDPAFAERVNEILDRNGYDVNAYEGLKKKRRVYGRICSAISVGIRAAKRDYRANPDGWY